jgi:hypothetical protein
MFAPVVVVSSNLPGRATRNLRRSPGMAEDAGISVTCKVDIASGRNRLRRVSGSKRILKLCGSRSERDP